MDQWIALLKGVNVGGNNRIKSADLAMTCRDLGWHDITTLLASGNVVFRASGGATFLADQLSNALVAHGLDVAVVVISRDVMKDIRRSCPFPSDEGKTVHGFFCLASPEVDETLIARFATQGEAVVSADRVIWLHTPNSFGTSALAKNFPRVVSGTVMTARNLNTISKLVEMLDK